LYYTLIFTEEDPKETVDIDGYMPLSSVEFIR